MTLEQVTRQAEILGASDAKNGRPAPVARVPRSLVWRVLDSPAAGFHWSAALAKVRGWA